MKKTGPMITPPTAKRRRKDEEIERWLPEDVVGSIMQFLNISEIFKASAVNQLWRRMGQNAIKPHISKILPYANEKQTEQETNNGLVFLGKELQYYQDAVSIMEGNVKYIPHVELVMAALLGDINKICQKMKNGVKTINPNWGAIKNATEEYIPGDNLGSTLKNRLCLLAFAMHEEAVKPLISGKTNLSPEKSNITIATFCVINGKIPLLQKAMDILKRTHYRSTTDACVYNELLQLAVKIRRTEVIDYLIKKMEENWIEIETQSLLDAAVISENLDNMEMLFAQLVKWSPSAVEKAFFLAAEKDKTKVVNYFLERNLIAEVPLEKIKGYSDSVKAILIAYFEFDLSEIEMEKEHTFTPSFTQQMQSTSDDKDNVQAEKEKISAFVSHDYCRLM